MAGIRLATMDDYDAYYRIKCGKSDIYWNGFSEAPNYDGLRDAFAQRLQVCPEIAGSKVLYMIEADDHVLCGFLMFVYNTPEVEVSFSILEEYQGRGYGTMAIREAVKLLEGFTAFAKIRPDNIPSQRCFEKNGFTFCYQEEEDHFFPIDNSYHRYNRFERK